MKNKILASILAGTFALGGCATNMKKSDIVIPEGYSPSHVQLSKEFRKENYVIGKAYASADDLDKKRKAGKIVDAWGRIVERQPISQDEYQRNCLENARDKAFSEIIKSINPKYTKKRTGFILIDLVVSSDDSGKKCYYEGAIGKDSLKGLYQEKKK